MTRFAFLVFGLFLMVTLAGCSAGQTAWGLCSNSCGTDQECLRLCLAHHEFCGPQTGSVLIGTGSRIPE